VVKAGVASLSDALFPSNAVTLRLLDSASTWIGDRMRAGRPSRYVASHLGRLSLLPYARKLEGLETVTLGPGGTVLSSSRASQSTRVGH